jgi:hypothetical protein
LVEPGASYFPGARGNLRRPVGLGTGTNGSLFPPSARVTEDVPPTELSRGFVIASVVDPFRNVLGLRFDPHFS